MLFLRPLSPLGAAVAGACVLGWAIATPAQVVPNPNDAQTQVNQQVQGFEITGGTPSADGQNLFHSFSQFDVPVDHQATFVVGDGVNTVLGRITSGAASIIDGQVWVTGTDTNLILMNPAGVLLGPESSVSVPGSFTVTTASGAQFGEHWWNAIGTNNYAQLTGTPQGFGFTALQPGAIVSSGTIVAGGDVLLAGGVTAVTGTISTPGTIAIASLSGNQQLTLQSPGSPLSFEITSLSPLTRPNELPFQPLDLPALLTGAGNTGATGLVANGDGSVTLLARNTPFDPQPGTTVVTGRLTGGAGVQLLGDRVIDGRSRNLMDECDPAIEMCPPDGGNSGPEGGEGEMEEPGGEMQDPMAPQDDPDMVPPEEPDTPPEEEMTPPDGPEMGFFDGEMEFPDGEDGPPPDDEMMPPEGPGQAFPEGEMDASDEEEDLPPLADDGMFPERMGEEGPMARDIPPELQGEDGLERIDSEVLDRLPGDGEEPRTLVRAIAGAEGDFDESLSGPGDNVTDGYGFEERGDPSGLDGGRFEGGRFEGLAPEDNVLALEGPALEGLGAEEFDGPGGLDPGGFDPEGLSAEGFDGAGDFDSEGLGAGEFDGPDSFDPEGLGPEEFDGPDGEEFGEPGDRPFGPEGEWDGEGPPRDEGAIALQNSGIAPYQLDALNHGDWQLDGDASSAFGLGEFDSGIDFVEQAWDRQFNGYGLDQTAVDTLSTSSIRDNLTVIADQTGERSALVYIMLQPTGLETVMVGPEGSPIFRRVRGINRETVLRTAFQFREAITNPVLRRSTAYKRSAQQLYGWIIEPLREELQAQNISTLLFAPDAGLRSLPFAALHDGDEFLVEQFSIGVTPSINLTDTDYVDLRAAPVLAMGASEFTGGLSPLPAVPLELQSIATSERPSQVLLNDEFTVDQLRTLRDRNPTPILHLATHGEFQTGTLDNSFIQFWGDERLTLDRLRDLQLNNPPVELLILSACRTAVGDPNAELGFAGVSVHAGVKSTLASVWYVADAGTLALMSQFYNALGDAPTKSQSLRQAQLALLRGEVRLEAGVLSTRGQRSINLPDASIQAFGDTTDLSHPYYWSGFTIIGSPW